ncbi:MAG: haloacid dehalogenase type II [Caldimonas sp.]
MLFDVNETLLDIKPLQKAVADVLLDDAEAKLWFTTMLQYSLVMTVSDRYASFGDIGAAVLQMLARNRDITLKADDAKQVLSVIRKLPPHPDVKPALDLLKARGIRLATLTNSSQDVGEAQMRHAGLDGFFERMLSVEQPRKFKPDRAVYGWAAGEMGVGPGECMLVAAHGWDVAGAKWAGLRAAFIAREGQQMFPLAEAPDVDAADLLGFAEKLFPAPTT